MSGMSKMPFGRFIGDTMDRMYIVLVSTATWLEMNLQTNPSAMLEPYLFCFCDKVSIPAGGQKSKDIAQNSFGQRS
jgi:hypothetical protein